MPHHNSAFSSVNTLIEQFRNTYSSSPTHVIRVPGRVNLIGEYIDYNGFPVLPIAIPHAITAVIRGRSDTKIRLSNTHTSFPAVSFDISKHIHPFATGHWGNYIKAAVQGILSSQGTTPHGVDIMVTGGIPHSAGLSSSSALVITGALSFLAANDITIEFIDLADILAEAERYVGTQGGGMDQAICLLGQKNHAVRIGFYPLTVSYVPFPADYSVVIAHSLVRSTKTENALVLYNHRPAECRLLTFLANSALSPDKPFERLGDIPQTQGIISGNADIESVISSFLPKDIITPSDIASCAGISIDTLMEECRLYHGSTVLIAPDERLPLRKRARHVFSETARVHRSCEALKAEDTKVFGQLMNESHESCDKLYDLSIPELNALVGTMRDGGAEGARLTGAGFGGCAVALVQDMNVEMCLENIRRNYYKGYLKKGESTIYIPDNLEHVLFTVKPADGASIETLE